MNPDLQAGLQALSNQFEVELAGTATPPQTSESFDVKPQLPAAPADASTDSSTGDQAAA